jgi:hypothetical protein
MKDPQISAVKDALRVSLFEFELLEKLAGG